MIAHFLCCGASFLVQNLQEQSFSGSRVVIRKSFLQTRPVIKYVIVNGHHAGNFNAHFATLEAKSLSKFFLSSNASNYFLLPRWFYLIWSNTHVWKCQEGSTNLQRIPPWGLHTSAAIFCNIRAFCLQLLRLQNRRWQPGLILD